MDDLERIASACDRAFKRLKNGEGSSGDPAWAQWYWDGLATVAKTIADEIRNAPTSPQKTENENGS